MIDTLQNVLMHELSHVHIRQHTGTVKFMKDIPGWFLEGLAVVTSAGAGAENVTDDQARTAIRNGIRFDAEDSGRIFGHKSAHNYGLEPHMYYRQADLFVRCLIGTDPEAFESVLTDVLNGFNFKDTWPEYYGRTILELWSSYLDKVEHNSHCNTLAGNKNDLP